MKALILAAGLGTRLRPITDKMPKPMVPVCNRPLIAFIVEQLIAADVRDLIVNLHHLPEAIEQYLPKTFPDARFTFSFESEILGTGGAIRNVRALLEGEDDFFVLNGDTLQRPPLGALCNARRKNDALAAMTLRHPPAGDRYTAVWLDDGTITGFGEGRGEALMYSGAQCVSRRIMQHLPKRPVSEIVGDVYCSTSEPLAGVVRDDSVWFDIGTPQRYITASRQLLDAMLRGEIAIPRGSHIDGDSLVHETARINGTIKHSVIGARSVVDGHVEESAIWDDCRIGAEATLSSAIVAHGVEVTRAEPFRNAVLA